MAAKFTDQNVHNCSSHFNYVFTISEAFTKLKIGKIITANTN